MDCIAETVHILNLSSNNLHTRFVVYCLVVVEIADKEQIGTVIEIIRNRLGSSYTIEE